MYKVKILQPAKHDIKQAATWYNSKQDGLGKRFTKELRKKISLIKDNPEISAIRFDNVRVAVLDVFPFVVHYIFDGSAILIVGIYHTSLSPNKWRK